MTTINQFTILIGVLCLIQSCTAPVSADYQTVDGETMGTYYAINYYDSKGRVFKPEIDSLLVQINQGVSTYIPSSTISQFNQSEDTFSLDVVNNKAVNQHFIKNFVLAQEVFKRTNGAFDPTVMPLVNYWGFGYSGKQAITSVDTLKIDSLIQLVGFDKVEYVSEPNPQLIKTMAGVQMDLSASAKGYGVDQIGLLLESYGVRDYLVDIGGEIRVKGKSRKGEDWKIGINVPEENARLNEIQEVIPVSNISIATSGNYRNFYEVDGVKYSHTINPFTGFPERNTLLSASVFSDNCIKSDAYATAFMVIGVEKAMTLAKQIDGLEAYFIYSKDNGEMSVIYTEGLKNRLNPAR